MSNAEVSQAVGDGAARVLVSNNAFLAAIMFAFFFLLRIYIPEWIYDGIGFFSVIVVPVALIAGIVFLCKCIYHAVQLQDDLAVAIYGVIFSYYALPFIKQEGFYPFSYLNNLLWYLSHIVLFLLFFVAIVLFRLSDKSFKFLQVITGIPLLIYLGDQYVGFFFDTINAVLPHWMG